MDMYLEINWKDHPAVEKNVTLTINCLFRYPVLRYNTGFKLYIQNGLGIDLITLPDMRDAIFDEGVCQDFMEWGCGSCPGAEGRHGDDTGTTL